MEYLWSLSAVGKQTSSPRESILLAAPGDNSAELTAGMGSAKQVHILGSQNWLYLKAYQNAADG